MNPFPSVAVGVFALAACFSTPVFSQVNITTFHSDNRRTGLNANETILSPANVNSNDFGKLFMYNVDGYVYAQPLFVSGLNIPGQGIHNAVFIATEHNTVYAFDADDPGVTGGLLWKTNFGTSAVTPTTDFGTRFGAYNNIVPEVGITSTPVIDLATGTIYVDAFTHEGASYFHRLHALNITNGQEEPYGPVLIAASYAGNGIGSVWGVINFVPKQQIQRAALTLAGGILYVAFAGYADTNPYHGWILGYNASNLQLLTNYVFNTTPNSTNGANAGEGGLWISNCGLTVDENTNLYFQVGNGPFNVTNAAGTEYGDCIMKLSTTNGLVVIDYFAPFNQASLESADNDMGSGGLLFLPDQPGPFPHLMVGAGKEGRIYLVNRDQFTAGNNHYNSAGSVDFVAQTIPPGQIGSCFDTPVWFNDRIYFAGSGNTLKAFSISNGLLSTTPVSTATRTYPMPGATPVVSANGTNNGIVWTLTATSPEVLVAYNPTNLVTEIYNTTQAALSRDRLTNGVKFTLPTVVNGKVYAAGQRGVAVLGLLNPYTNWKYAHFGNDATNPAVSDALADPDNDGKVNLLEYAFASDPNSTNTCCALSAAIVGNQIQLQFPRNTSAKDLTYIVQTADVLGGSWTDMMTFAPGGSWVANLPASTAAETPPQALSPDRYVAVTVTDPRTIDSTSATGRFFRLLMHQ